MATDENEKILIDLVVVKGSGSDPGQHFKIQSITQENVEKAQLVIGQSTFTSGDSPGGGGGGISDVRVNGTSVVSNGIAYISAATTSDTGVITTGSQSFAGAKTFEGTIVSRSAVAYNKTQGSSYAVGLGDDGTGNREALYYSKPISDTDYFLNVVADTPENAPSDTDTILTLPWKTGTIATLDDITSAIGDINSALTTLNTGTGV